MEKKEKIMIIGEGAVGKMAVAELMKQNHDVILVEPENNLKFNIKDGAELIPVLREMVSIVDDDGIPKKIQIMQHLPECKGRHTYVQKPGSTQNGSIITSNPWVCKHCGKEL